VLESADLLFISRKDFQAVCMEHPQVALKVLQVVGGRLRRLVGIIEELSFTTVRHRLISWLLRQARAEIRSEGGRPLLTLTGGHQELASHIGTVRELVSRNLTRLQTQGFIRLSGREIEILDEAGLEADLASVI
jgi:CRP/FNR family transcriptional regulator, cyclic AMP receptor protein